MSIFIEGASSRTAYAALLGNERERSESLCEPTTAAPEPAAILEDDFTSQHPWQQALL